MTFVGLLVFLYIETLIYSQSNLFFFKYVTDSTMNTDPRGVQRGKCSGCDCEQYEFEITSGRAACSYCNCPPTAHEKLEATAVQ